MAESRQAGLTPQPEATQHLIANFQRLAFLEKADFKQPFGHASQAPAALPLGNTPMLVTEVQITPQAGQQLLMVFHHELPGHTQLQSARLVLGSELLQGFLHLSQAAMQNVEWISIDAPPYASVQAEAPTPPHTAH